MENTKLNELEIWFMIVCAIISLISAVMCTKYSDDAVALQKELLVEQEYSESMEEELKKADEYIKSVQDENKRLEEVIDKLNAVDYNLEYVVRVVATECGNEPFEGQMAVAQTIMERAKAKGITPEEVVKEKNQYAPPSDISKVNGQTWLACKRVFLDGEKVTEKPIQFFYAPAICYSADHEAREYVMTIGGHKFFM